MPRIPRKSLESKYFHVMVQGIAKDFIFNNNEYKEHYIRLLYKYKEQFNIELLAFCIMDNHAHLLLYIDNIENMSSYMQKTNTLFAMYYNKELNNRVGHVFRNRFKSEEIISENHLINCIKYIHNNPVKAKMVKRHKEYKYSSYKDYLYKRGIALNNRITKIIDINDIFNCEEEQSFIDIESDKEIYIDKIVREVLNKINNNEITIEEKINIINELKEKHKIPLTKACEIMNINERTYRRKKREMSELVRVPKTDKWR